MFPVSIQGLIDVPLNDAEAVLTRLENAVTAANATSIERGPGKLTFRGAGPWISMWRPLSFFDYCEVTVESGKIRYDCSTRHLLLLISAFVALFSLALSRAPKIPAVLIIIIPIVAWLWTFGGNYLAGLGRFRNFLSTAVRDSRDD
jgi:hypothetical protein